MNKYGIDSFYNDNVWFCWSWLIVSQRILHFCDVIPLFCFFAVQKLVW